MLLQRRHNVAQGPGVERDENHQCLDDRPADDLPRVDYVITNKRSAETAADVHGNPIAKRPLQVLTGNKHKGRCRNTVTAAQRDVIISLSSSEEEEEVAPHNGRIHSGDHRAAHAGNYKLGATTRPNMMTTTQLVPEPQQQVEPDYHTFLGALTDMVNLVASAKGIKSHNILGPNTLHDLSRLRPMRRQELERVEGLGSEKLRKYGQAILDVIKSVTMYLSGQKEGRISQDHSYVLDPLEFVWDEMLTSASTLPAGNITTSSTTQLLQAAGSQQVHPALVLGTRSGYNAATLALQHQNSGQTRLSGDVHYPQHNNVLSATQLQEHPASTVSHSRLSSSSRGPSPHHHDAAAISFSTQPHDSASDGVQIVGVRSGVQLGHQHTSRLLYAQQQLSSKMEPIYNVPVSHNQQGTTYNDDQMMMMKPTAAHNSYHMVQNKLPLLAAVPSTATSTTSITATTWTSAVTSTGGPPWITKGAGGEVAPTGPASPLQPQHCNFDNGGSEIPTSGAAVVASRQQSSNSTRAIPPSFTKFKFITK
ncbi:hypothetical protein CEUSTIGMA_g13103.t1 [Chlamydomonas eustigma]|uniref:HRDC domain-containing protein n=1 Tax=Chlamydomonas eustigma TaxID=1157962 RepID=A0A250XRJ4_9CHLO|nr:hypothetical protein CEUSTIGMA_g13103.t1 [Chlamydomonas eustigma]|eukprot:GAX85688.1 hypothetical protein CEUSTIGMA_g13103.t1 [Chlamydomonas eustigma]